MNAKPNKNQEDEPKTQKKFRAELEALGKISGKLCNGELNHNRVRSLQTYEWVDGDSQRPWLTWQSGFIGSTGAFIWHDHALLLIGTVVGKQVPENMREGEEYPFSNPAKEGPRVHRMEEYCIAIR
jgi:hypothetical protein